MKFKLFALTIFIGLLNLHIAQAKYYKCDLMYTNGNKVEAFIKMPLSGLLYKTKVKFEENGKPEKIKVEDLLFIQVYFGNSEKALFKVGELSLYSRRKEEFRAPLKGYFNIGLVMGIDENIVLTRHGDLYEIKKKNGVEKLYTVYYGGFATWLSTLEGRTLVELNSLVSKKEINIQKTVELIFPEARCASDLYDLEKDDVQTIESVLEFVKRYNECAKEQK